MSDIKSKVPGVIDEILVAEGDKIERGQHLLVMEAMKMKMPILATAAGTVKTIAIKLGDRVNPGSLLVEIDD